jgi:SNF2 family DNA or RNA helicase
MSTSTLRPRSAMHPAQIQVADLLIEKCAIAAFLEAGFGKTIAVGDGIARLINAGKVSRVLVLGPPRVVNGGWTRELAKWQHTAHLKVIPVVGNAAQRIALLKTPGPVVLCLSLHQAQWLLSVASQIPGPQMLVVDESSFIKSPTAKMTKAAVSIARGCKYRVILSGTPRPQGAHELWSQLYVVDFGQRLGVRHSEFLSRYFYQAGPYRIAPVPGAVDQINAQIEDVVRTARAEDYIRLPELRRNLIEVELCPAARRTYDSVERGILRDLETGQAQAVRGGPAATFGKLAQVANGGIYALGAWTDTGTEKLDALSDLLAGMGEPALIFYRFVADRDRILARIPGAEHFTASNPAALSRLLERWAAGDIPALVAHPKAAAHGIDGLQAARHLVWFGLPLGSVEQLLQAEARIHRQGAKGTTFIHELRAVDTIDEVIAKTLQARRSGQDAFMEALADHLRARHGAAAPSIAQLTHSLGANALETLEGSSWKHD